jgi:hypothetical protein
LRKIEQEIDVKMIIKGILDCTQNFEMDKLEYDEVDFNPYIKNKLLTKSLGNDTLYFTEGFKKENNPDFISEKETKDDYLNYIAMETLSGGDNKVEMKKKSDVLKLRNKSEFGMFE